ncbi:MAG: hypothetical protein C4308_00855 [Chitinophagaceae bacterium]
MQANSNWLLTQFSKVETIARSSPLKKLFRIPLRYIVAKVYQVILCPLTGKSFLLQARLFYGKPFLVNAPAALDIFIAGGKTDDSELRLTKFLINI